MNLSPSLAAYALALAGAAAVLTLATVRASRPGVTPPRAIYWRALFAGLRLYSLLVAGYFVLRYQGQWMENDTATITQAVQAMRAQGSLHPDGPVYQHGFGYQAVSLALLAVTGLAPQTLQTAVFPFLGALAVVLTSFLLFAAVTGERRAATLGVLLLLFQPDVLFVTLRGSHEKLTWPLMMLALALFYGSLRRPVGATAVYVGLFYLTVLALISTNVFFSSVFLVSLAFSLALGVALGRILPRRKPGYPLGRVVEAKRLLYLCASCAVLTFVFAAYVYPVALLNLRTLSSIVDRVGAFLLSFEIGGQPYEYIAFGWVSPQVYLALTAFTWLLLAASLAEWLRRGLAILEGREKFGLASSLDWLLYAGFALQVAVSILVDFSGVLSANLQLRLFPGFTVMAAGLLARGLWRALARPRVRGGLRWAALGAGGLATVWFALASALKATNEPALSNKWSFYSSAEAAALRWTGRDLQAAHLWSGIDERLAVVFLANESKPGSSQTVYEFGEFEAEQRYVLSSATERLRGARLKVSLPETTGWARVYDNGEVQLYHRPAPELLSEVREEPEYGR